MRFFLYGFFLVTFFSCINEGALFAAQLSKKEDTPYVLQIDSVSKIQSRQSPGSDQFQEPDFKGFFDSRLDNIFHSESFQQWLDEQAVEVTALTDEEEEELPQTACLGAFEPRQQATDLMDLNLEDEEIEGTENLPIYPIKKRSSNKDRDCSFCWFFEYWMGLSSCGSRARPSIELMPPVPPRLSNVF